MMNLFLNPKLFIDAVILFYFCENYKENDFISSQYSFYYKLYFIS